MITKQAIVTKYLGPTNTKGTRVKATCFGGSITISWDYSLESEYNHKHAALILAKKMGWKQKGKSFNFLGGSLPKGYVFIQK